MYSTVNAFFPSFGPQPPPPPPPRRTLSDARELPCADNQPATVAEPRQGSSARNAGQASSSRHSKTSNTANSNKGGGQSAKQWTQLESRISKVETETQALYKALAADMAKLRKERETAWKHVSELQEQNRLMRQRQRDLEEQNSMLSRLLQEHAERLMEKTPVLPQYPPEAALPRPPLIALSLNQQPAVVAMPKVPHMGTEIW